LPAPAPQFSAVVFSVGTAITSQRQLRVNIDFGRKVTGFELSDLVLTNARTIQLIDRTNGAYELILEAIQEGVVSIDLPANRVQDLVGTANQMIATYLMAYVDLSLPGPIVLGIGMLGEHSLVIGSDEIRIVRENELLFSWQRSARNGLRATDSAGLDVYRINDFRTIPFPKVRYDSASKQLFSEVKNGDVEGTVAGWLYSESRLVGGILTHQFSRSNTIINVQSEMTRKNPLNTLDINGDGFVAALDVLIIINRLNERATGLSEPGLPPFDPSKPSPYFFFDASGNGSIEPLDILLVINFLNRLVVQRQT